MASRSGRARLMMEMICSRSCCLCFVSLPREQRPVILLPVVARRRAGANLYPELGTGSGDRASIANLSSVQEFSGAKFRARRLAERLVRVSMALSMAPDASFPRALPTSADGALQKRWSAQVLEVHAPGSGPGPGSSRQRRLQQRRNWPKFYDQSSGARPTRYRPAVAPPVGPRPDHEHSRAVAVAHDLIGRPSARQGGRESL